MLSIILQKKKKVKFSYFFLRGLQKPLILLDLFKPFPYGKISET